MLSRTRRRLEKELNQIKRDHSSMEVIIPDDEELK